MSSKTASVKEGRRNNSSDAESIQSIHDTTADLGASCDGAKSFRRGSKNLVSGDTKSIVGSVEALQDRISDALDEIPAYYVFLRGVLAEESICVFDVIDQNYDLATFQQSYSDDGTTVTLLGAPSEVNLLEVIVAVPTDPTITAKSATDDAGESAEAAAQAAASAEDPASDVADDATPAEVAAAMKVHERSLLLVS